MSDLDFPKVGLTVLVAQNEMDGIRKLATEKDMSVDAVVRAAIRMYQLIDFRVRAGEDMTFSGDRQRQRDFAGPLWREQYEVKIKEMDWPFDVPFQFADEPGEHEPCYVIMPGGAMLPLAHHATNGVDQARARFIVDACNTKLVEMK